MKIKLSVRNKKIGLIFIFMLFHLVTTFVLVRIGGSVRFNDSLHAETIGGRGYRNIYQDAAYVLMFPASELGTDRGVKTFEDAYSALPSFDNEANTGEDSFLAENVYTIFILIYFSSHLLVSLLWGCGLASLYLMTRRHRRANCLDFSRIKSIVAVVILVAIVVLPQIGLVTLVEAQDSSESDKITKTAGADVEVEIKLSPELSKLIDPLKNNAQARSVAYFIDGKSIGIRIFAIDRGSIFEKIGLQNGDILLTADKNESVVQDIPQLTNFIKKLLTEKIGSLKIKRQSDIFLLKFKVIENEQ